MLIALLGWYTFSSLSEATAELERESKQAGDSSEEYSDVQAFCKPLEVSSSRSKSTRRIILAFLM